MLTTITPYWGRSAMLQSFLRHLATAHIPQVYHFILVLDDPIPTPLNSQSSHLKFIRCQGTGVGNIRPSIGYLHNIGAKLATTEWIMKLDVDAMPNQRYFTSLMEVLKTARPREWFNGGMFYLSKPASERYLSKPITAEIHRDIIAHLGTLSASHYRAPAATNFICRREDYLNLGGCDSRFAGWGWEDYQQIYMLEKHQRGEDPLPGLISFDNIAARCRDEISRPKAKELYARDSMLALLHHYHPISKDPTYKSSPQIERNRSTLLEYILKSRSEGLASLLASCEVKHPSSTDSRMTRGRESV